MLSSPPSPKLPPQPSVPPYLVSPCPVLLCPMSHAMLTSRHLGPSYSCHVIPRHLQPSGLIKKRHRCVTAVDYLKQLNFLRWLNNFHRYYVLFFIFLFEKEASQAASRLFEITKVLSVAPLMPSLTLNLKSVYGCCTLVSHVPSQHNTKSESILFHVD